MHRYPSESQKEALREATGLTARQVNTWFTNARVKTLSLYLRQWFLIHKLLSYHVADCVFTVHEGTRHLFCNDCTHGCAARESHGPWKTQRRQRDRRSSGTQKDTPRWWRYGKSSGGNPRRSTGGQSVSARVKGCAKQGGTALRADGGRARNQRHRLFRCVFLFCIIV